MWSRVVSWVTTAGTAAIFVFLIWEVARNASTWLDTFRAILTF
jgi:hypothetical protein